MGGFRLWSTRAWARRASLAVIAAFVALATALVSLAWAGVDIAATGAIRQALGAAGDGPALTVRTRLAEDAAAQDARLHELSQAQLEPLPLDIGRHLVTEPVATAADGDPVRVEYAAVDPGSVTADGEWPGPSEALVPPDSALAGVTALEVDGTTFAVAGTWEPTAAVASGGPGAPAQNSAGIVLLASEEAVLAIDDEPFVVWGIQPDVARVGIEDLGLLAGAGDRLNQELRRDDAIAVRGLTVEDSTGEVATDLRPRVAAARAVTLVPVGLLAALTALTLTQLAGLLSRSRAGESALLASRGSRRASLAAAGAAEGAVAGGLGAVAGALLAAGVLALIPDGVAGRGVLLPTAIAATLVTAVALAASAASSFAAPATRAAHLRAGRRRRVGSAGTFAALALVTAYAAARFADLGGPVLGAGTDRASGDLLAVGALPLAVVVIGLIAVLLLGPATALVERAARRGQGLDGPLAARQVARRLASYAVPALLLALGAASVTVAAGFDGTAAAQRRTDATLVNGADVRAILPEQNWAPAALPRAADPAPYAALGGADTAVPARTAGVSIGMQPASFVAVPADALGEVVGAPGTAAELAAFADELTVEPESGLLPEGAAEVRLGLPLVLATVDGLPATESLGVELSAVMRVLDAGGGLHVMQAPVVAATIPPGEAGAAGDTAPIELVAPLPPAARQVISVEFTLGIPLEPIPAGPVWPDYTEEMTDAEYEDAVDEFLEAEGAMLEDGVLDTMAAIQLEVGQLRVSVGGVDTAAPFPIRAREPDNSSGWWLRPTETGSLMEVYLGELPRVGSLAFSAVSTDVPAIVPALVTEALAEELALEPGATLDVALDGPSLPITVTGIVPALPGVTDTRAVLVDQATATAHLAATRQTVTGPTEVWISGDADAVAGPALSLAGEGATVTTPELPALDPSSAPRLTFWLAGGAGALAALIGVAAAAVVQAAERRREVGVLVALGVPPRCVGRARALELLAVALPALLLGAGAGALVGSWFVPDLARSATAGLAAIGMRPAWGPLLAAVVFLLVGVVGVASLAGARVRDAARAAGRLEDDS